MWRQLRFGAVIGCGSGCGLARDRLWQRLWFGAAKAGAAWVCGLV